jgi:hypothetical protein
LKVLVRCKNSATTQRKTLKKKSCTRQTKNKLKKELQEKIIKNKAKEVEEAKQENGHKSSNSFRGVTSKICKKNTYTILK